MFKKKQRRLADHDKWTIIISQSDPKVIPYENKINTIIIVKRMIQ